MSLSPKKRKSLTLSSVFFTFFVDNLSWSIVFPIFAPFFIDEKNLIFSPEISLPIRTTILGLFLMSFPLAQFFGAPLLGEYADKHGRKKALVISVFFTVIGLALTGWSIHQKFLVILFFSRLGTGFFSGNLSICLAAVGDLSPNEKTKIKYFGYLAVIAGLSFILGTFIGGKFSDSSLSPLFSPELPLWIATALTLINFFYVAVFFKETQTPDPSVRFDLLEGIHNIQKTLRVKKIKTIYFIYFLFLFSWFTLFQFTPVLVIDRFSFTNSEIGDLSAFMGICWALGSGLFNKLLLKRFAPLKVLEFSLISFTILCGLVSFSASLWQLISILGLCVLFASLGWPLCNHLISSLANKNIQGKIMGVSQSMISLAMAISPIIGGVADHISLDLTFLIASFSSLAAALIYFRVKS